MKSQSMQDYLKAIYQIQENQNGNPVSTSSLAEWLGVTSASVTGMVKRFSSSDPKLVEYEPYAGVTLTDAGQRIALEVIRHHRLIESYLSRMLGYSWDEVHEEAERLEHVISEAMEERMAKAMGYPITDPHGDPIPDREGNFLKLDAFPLSQLPDEQQAIIKRVVGQEPDLLRYLTEQGLTLSTRIKVVFKAPFNGPINIHVFGPSETNLALGREVADKILILPLTASPQEQSYEQSIQS
jgi:DtxR family transcriptional regulator, Mn-dependent transcriptional regulator